MDRIASRIEEVTVYAGAARVRRVAEVVVDGVAEVRLGGLPLALRDDSVRLSATGLVATGTRVVVEVPDVDVALPPADPAEREAAERDVALADAEVARLGEALGALDALAPGPRPERQGDPLPSWSAAVEARLALVALRAERERTLRASLATAETTQLAAHRRLERARDADLRATSARAARPNELKKAIVVSLRGERGTIALDYVVPGARWAPSYLARLDGDEARLEVRAVIAQETGEDWRGVRLALSTAAAQSWTELPELPSLRIGRRQPPPPRAGWKAPPTGAELLYADWDRAFAGRIAPPETKKGEVVIEEHDEDELALDVLDRSSRATMVDFRAADKPMAAPAPEYMFAPQSAAKRSGGIGAAIGGLVAAPVALAAAGAGAIARGLKKEAARDEGGARRQHAGATTTEEVPAELHAPADLLAYGDLRMPPASSPARGRLEPADRRDLYLSLLVSHQVTVSFDVLVAIGDAERRAAVVANRAPPPGMTSSWSDAYDYAFRADGAVDVPSDGGWHGIALAARTATVQLRHVVVPRESCDVFRLADLDNPLDAPLLPGPIDVYDGRDFVLTSAVSFTPPRGRLELGLGVDLRVKAARRSRYQEETTGMLRGSLRLEHAVEIDVENLSALAIDLEVRERIPVRAVDDDDDVDVEVGEVAPAWEAWAPEPDAPGAPRLRGGRCWKVALAPTAKQTLVAAYTVKIAAKHELVGGNRREP